MKRFLPIAAALLLFGAVSASGGCIQPSGGDGDAQPTDTPLVDGGHDGSDSGPPGEVGGETTDIVEPVDILTDVPFDPDPFVYATTCQLPPQPPGTGEVNLVLAFENLPPGSISYPMGMGDPADGSNRLFVYERYGKIKFFDNDPGASKVQSFLNIGGKLFTGGEGGLLGLAFHPDYANNGHFFVNYTVQEAGDIYTLVSRFTADQADPNKANPNSEIQFLKISQPFSNHNGGEIAFGHDGYLYVGMGDGGAGGDPFGHGQNTTTLLGAMLRIDVDLPMPGKNYGIPPDNPFASDDGPEADEIWAWGLRNPWRFSFDQVTGQLWTGDVGQKAWEEIDIVEGGKNYGWNTMEGLVCYPPPNTVCDESGFTPPILHYATAGKGSVTGGYVYRGTQVPSLYGTYIFADYEHKTLWLYPTDQSPPVGPAMQAPTRIAGFGQDASGEVYVMGLLNGAIYRFETVLPAPAAEDFPQTLSDTGCFKDMATLEPAEGVLPYELVLPFWSDLAAKERFVVLPDGGKIGYDDEKRWSFPDGTMFIKHFFIETVAGDPQSATRLETRLLVLEGDYIRGYVYRWNEAGTEATLLESGATRPLDVVGPGGVAMQFDWQFPARHQCTSCHTEQTGGALGLETAQLNRMGVYQGVAVNQIEAWAAWDLFENAPPATDTLPPAYRKLGDDAASLEERSRAWLHVNCANCHDGSPGTGMDMDLSFHTSLAGSKLCNINPQKGDLAVDGAKLLVPGDSDASILYLRSVTAPPYRMPPLASSLIDEEGTAVLKDWIDSLGSCP